MSGIPFEEISPRPAAVDIKRCKILRSSSLLDRGSEDLKFDSHVQLLARFLKVSFDFAFLACVALNPLTWDCV